MAGKTIITSAGRALTDIDIERLADEAEEGYEPDQLAKRPRGRPPLGAGPAATIQVRIAPELKAKLDERRKAERVTASEIVRDALNRYLSA